MVSQTGIEKSLVYRPKSGVLRLRFPISLCWLSQLWQVQLKLLRLKRRSAEGIAEPVLEITISK